MSLVTLAVVFHKSEGFGPSLSGEMITAGLVQYDPETANEGSAQFTGLTSGADGDSTKVVIYTIPARWDDQATTTAATVIALHIPTAGAPPVPDDS
jgi:hypothetical protein